MDNIKNRMKHLIHGKMKKPLTNVGGTSKNFINPGKWNQEYKNEAPWKDGRRVFLYALVNVLIIN